MNSTVFLTDKKTHHAHHSVSVFFPPHPFRMSFCTERMTYDRFEIYFASVGQRETTASKVFFMSHRIIYANMLMHLIRYI